MKILITRPLKQAQTLAKQIRAKGDIPLFCPTLEIKAILDPEIISQALKKLNTYDFLIFVSPNAVWEIIEYLKEKWPSLPQGLQLLAIGAGTKNALVDAGLKVHFIPEDQFNSEGLLELPALNNIKQKNILMITGLQGRNLLKETLVARGASVTQLAVYESLKPALTLEEARLLKSLKFDMILATSVLGLNNLIAKAKEAGQANLQQKPLLVISQRLAEEAKALGFTNVTTAENATNSAILSALEFWKIEHMTEEQQKTESPSLENTEQLPVKKRSGFSCVFTFMALVLSICAVVETSIILKKSHLLKASLAFNKQMILDNKKQFESLTNQVDTLNKTQASQEKLIEKLANSTNTDTVNWTLTGLKYLVQQANIDLEYEYNINGAMQLLQLGIIQLESQAEASLIPLEKNLKDSLALLKAVPQINKANLLDHITVLSNQIVTLPLVELKIDTTTHPLKPELPKNASFWDKLWKNTWYELQKLIVIKRHEQLIHPLLSAPQQDVLVKNIQFLLGQTKWAVLYNNPDIYEASLTQAMDWVKKYFVTTAPATQVVLNDITELQKINLKSHLPNLSETENLIDQLRSQVVKENAQ